MALITYILIAIPVCLLAIILWLCFDYWKYKRKNHFILLILLFIRYCRMRNIRTKHSAKSHFHRMQTSRVNWNIPKTA